MGQTDLGLLIIEDAVEVAQCTLAVDLDGPVQVKTGQAPGGTNLSKGPAGVAGGGGPGGGRLSTTAPGGTTRATGQTIAPPPGRGGPPRGGVAPRRGGDADLPRCGPSRADVAASGRVTVSQGRRVVLAAVIGWDRMTTPLALGCTPSGRTAGSTLLAAIDGTVTTGAQTRCRATFSALARPRARSSALAPRSRSAGSTLSGTLGSGTR